MIKTDLDYKDTILAFKQLLAFPDHLDSKDCWCRPELEYESETGNQVWVHREVH